MGIPEPWGGALLAGPSANYSLLATHGEAPRGSAKAEETAPLAPGGVLGTTGGGPGELEVGLGSRTVRCD